MKKYNIIYADPPWSYNDTQESGGTKYFGASVRYELMKNDDIYNLSIKNIADKNCTLFLWATSPLLQEAFKTISEWGFKYKTVAFCWNKVSKHYKDISNMGRWTMGNIELCLLGTRGKPQRRRKDIKQLVREIRYKHSEKPHIVRERIVELMGDIPRIELFTRHKVDGWDSYGNEELQEAYIQDKIFKEK